MEWQWAISDTNMHKNILTAFQNNKHMTETLDLSIILKLEINTTKKSKGSKNESWVNICLKK
jgi:hypothetical protein